MDSHKDVEQSYIIVPPEKLSKEALTSLIEEFILREGTDYGAQEISLEKKLSRGLKQIEAGIVSIVFNPETETCTILKANELSKLV